MMAAYYVAVMFFFGTTTYSIFDQFFLNTTTPHCVCALWYESSLFNHYKDTASPGLLLSFPFFFFYSKRNCCVSSRGYTTCLCLLLNLNPKTMIN
jgi:hypothetical protein